MFNSLNLQYLIQAPDYHPFSSAEGCISGCASGISPVLKAFHRVFVDETIIRQIRLSNSLVPVAWGNPRRLYGTSTTKNIERNISDVLNRSRFMVAVPLEEF